MSTKPHTYETYETLRKTSFCTNGNIKIYKQSIFRQKDHMRNSCIKFLNGKHKLYCLLYVNFFGRNTKILIFGGILKFYKLIVFG
jgi:hypothetical protein